MREIWDVKRNVYDGQVYWTWKELDHGKVYAMTGLSDPRKLGGVKILHLPPATNLP